MAKWKLCRQIFGNEEFEFSEGDEVRIGRGLNNTITLSSIVVSRNHCIINFKREGVFITDLKSANGIYVGLKRIPPNIPYALSETDLIGFGWTVGAPLVKILDSEKFVFKLTKCAASIISRIKYQSNSDDDIEAEISTYNFKNSKPVSKILESPTKNTKLQLKRKLNGEFNDVNVKSEPIDNGVINILSDSDNESKWTVKKAKIIPKIEDVIEEDTKYENEDLQYEAFNVKQEYLGYDEDEPIQIDSDSDSESEQWFLRLSQSSPGKPFTKIDQISLNSDMSKFDNIECNDNEEEDFIDDIISIPPEPTNQIMSEINVPENQTVAEIKLPDTTGVTETTSPEVHPIIKVNVPDNELPLSMLSEAKERSEKDQVDKICNENIVQEIEKAIVPSCAIQQNSNILIKKAQMIEPLVQSNQKKTHHSSTDSKSKHSSKKKNSKHSSSSIKKVITNSQKEERKRKLKEIADKEKKLDDDDSKKSINNTNKIVSNVRYTASNRGAFLTDAVNTVATVKPMKRRNSQEKEKNKLPPTDEKNKSPPTDSVTTKEHSNSKRSLDKTKNYEKSKTKVSVGSTESEIKDKTKVNKTTSKTSSNSKSQKSKDSDHRNLKSQNENKESLPRKSISKVEPLPPTKLSNSKSQKSKDSDHRNLKSQNENKESLPKVSNLSNSKSQKSKDSDHRNLKSQNENKESLPKKPISKVEPLPPSKPKKKVRFSDADPIVHEFEIEPGNLLKKTNSVKSRLLDVQQKPIYSLEKITLKRILDWKPHWLNVQIGTEHILGHSHPPMTMFHSFNSHSQYTGLVGDLLLMEIWECIAQSYKNIRNLPNKLQLKFESLKYFELLLHLNVNISLPTSELNKLPRVGEIIMLEFGPTSNKNCRFFFVHNVRCLPSPQNNINSFFSLALYATHDNIPFPLKSGDIMTGRTLAYINKELMLFEAMEYLAGSPLCHAILKPEPCHYQTNICDNTINMNTQWTVTLNSSQKLAVSRSVSAALGVRPSIQMVQGPPGTGKSSVICAIVMSYFYVATNKKQDRGKILICATSNAAVDELVIRLLNIRQSLPKEQRFRMVRVGRLEAMHARARDVSSQQLAQRDAVRLRADCAPPGRDEEISHLEARINMYKAQFRDARDPAQKAFYHGKIENLVKRISLLRGGELSAERLVQAERRIVDCADIVVTTLASAHNYKMKGLKGRIALCIVDEAGQAIEPETLIPLTLDVTHLTLIGDPQQLPGFICSQRAKEFGLGESLFSRLTSGLGERADGPVVLLDRQYRMHPAIAAYPNRAFYGGRVTSVAPPAPGLDLPPYTLLAVSGGKGQEQSGANESEAWGVARVAAALAGGVRSRGLSLAVITPYSAHRDLLRACLRDLDPSASPVEVNTVDSFQGQERDVVLVSLARSRGVGFLTDAGRMNVMLTRARHALLVCLDPLAVQRNFQWQTLVDDARERGVYKTLPYNICRHPSVRSITNEEVLKYVKNA